MTGAADAERPASAPSAPRGVLLGIDVGDARVGLARSDRDGLIATPVETLDRQSAVAGVVSHALDTGARGVVVGLPRSLSGAEGAAAAKARDFADELAAALRTAEHAAEIRFIDERLTTVSAHQALHSSGRKGRKHRAVVDQVAAVMILQQALDMQRAAGSPPGELLEPPLPTPDPQETGR
ncbi:Holliday junction resolvase RuvX [Brachybacterium sp. JHP9]|uniref:Putative pre-16S rRNA nuclease n=1 Tax=Brachybacterium equifaecis TaxID=2910770 RepID=A0ABT0R2G5_9MICO|nr:Holliday junction resolvase RuvX [Brachybacterium equifaecis]MCL6424091.1 Holliday junction resolvase RuvX [Brachybacterium equifaecis]